MTIEEILDKRLLTGPNRVGLRVGPLYWDFYGYFIEYGWTAGGSSRYSKTGTDVPARPFLRPAIDEAAGAAIEAASAVFRSKLESM